MSNKRGISNTNYTNVSFEEIKETLVNRAKKYYPDTYQDFNQSSFGSMMMDMLAMMGEQLNFYTQFVANENFLETSRTSQGLVSAARNNGIEIFNKFTSVGSVRVYSRVPSDATYSGPDKNYTHTILKGMTISSDSGVQYTTTKDATISFDPDKLVSSEFLDDGGRTSFYVYMVDVPVVSGENRTISVEVGTYRKFLKVEIKDSSITEVLSVVDSNGNEFYEVDNLSQGVVYKEVPNQGAASADEISRLLPFPVPRRFTIQHEGERTFLVFGFGSEKSLKIKPVADPSEIALKLSGKNYLSDNVFDPSNMSQTDKFGVSPENTTLTITYRSSNLNNSNTGAKTLNNIITSDLLFPNQDSLDAGTIQYIKNSLSCENLEPINGSLDFTSTREVSETIRSALGYRGRAVTKNDYISACYAMPSRFGSVKRASLVRDHNDLKRNLNLFIISQDESGNLEAPSSTLKSNLKHWLNSLRMVSDTIDVFNAKILNLSIFFDVFLNEKADKITALSEIRKKVFYELSLSSENIGEAFSIGRIEKIINSMPTVDRVASIKLTNKFGGNYSDIRYDIETNLSTDGGLLLIPEDFICEIKNESDINGKVQ